jgi:cytochrome oxidase Cu insertion factor (SCO1/SenC/PrrC family)
MTISKQARSRLILLLVALMFLGSFGVAAALFFSGWKPTQTRNIGEMLSPYPDLRDIPLIRADGQPWQWQADQRNWHILVDAPAGCGQPCSQMLNVLHRVWVSEGRHAERVKVLWFGELPADAPQFSGLVPMRPSPALQARLPDVARADALPVYLADPNGYLILRYAPGFNPSGLRKDLSRVVK